VDLGENWEALRNIYSLVEEIMLIRSCGVQSLELEHLRSVEMAMHLSDGAVLVAEQAVLAVVADIALVEHSTVLILENFAVAQDSCLGELFLAMSKTTSCLIFALVGLEPILAQVRLVVTVSIAGDFVGLGYGLRTNIVSRLEVDRLPLEVWLSSECARRLLIWHEICRGNSRCELRCRVSGFESRMLS